MIDTGTAPGGGPLTVNRIVTCSLTATEPYGGPCVYSFVAWYATETSYDLTQATDWDPIGQVTVTSGLEKLWIGAGTYLRVPVGLSLLSSCAALVLWMW